MLHVHRPRLIQDLTDTALGLIAEAETRDPQDARALVELAGSLDKLRVKLISDVNPVQCLTTASSWEPQNHH